MRVRHKQPTLVSMWMLDVFCCALGCVTLLFLLNSRMASDEAEANKTALIDLRTTERKLAATLDELDKLRLRLNSEEAGRQKLSAALTEAEGLRLKLSDEAAALAKQLATTTADRDDLAKKLALSQKEAKDAKALADATQLALNAAEAKVTADAKELATVRAMATDADDVLRKKQKEADALAKKLVESNASAEDLARLLRKRDDEKVALAKQAADLKKELDDLDAKTAGTRKEFDAAAAQIKDLTKKVSDANVTIVDLQGDKARLADKLDKLQKETDARFAGIVTAGKRVVFLVDISGSMAKRDSETADPTKWPIVVETVSKVMRSVVGLEKYQIVIFSSSAKWLFGTGDWRDYEGEKSIDDVKKALAAVKPHDDTNLHAGLEKAFSLRESGLDVIYLFSDGLPTSGPGLTLAEQTRRPPLTELELGEKLGKHIRKTLSDTWNRPLAGKPRVKIHAVGFFFESPDVGAFLWALARENDGSFVGMSKP
ncbi:Secreted protein, containing von Willebrand factor type A domain containing protein OS=Methylophaga aminisulfidivorans MP GN=MAMP_01096 PE=4 SV=1: VWA_2 [Gemmataceae bacterium]|nr:Secreted protein, containing von Willebrand factor type A domain containing protein OS=Methylophaga aminisulfidivorans MP GN=MAMP_01096 PE=4 SV=1: VWA_2 [Gemmataceae bacterium]VTT97260.1 Secreted protein, containing von Willebrand factor type A domain containing protein OS=Methylophaga aminisulfidivorans MP GN=MAMP_01096 PE=4 SV=1: VWA_2 [Gemmataceae bacterium]